MGSCVSTSIHKYAVTNVTDTADTADTTDTTGQVVATQPLVKPVATVVPALDAAALEAMNMLDITTQVQTTVQSWLAGLQPIGSAGSAGLAGLVGVAGVVEDRAVVVDKLSAMFAKNDSTYQYSTRSANRVLQDANAHSDFFKQHNYHWYLCRQFDQQMRQHGSKLAQCSIKTAQCMVIALLAKQQSNQPKLLDQSDQSDQLDQLDNSLLSHCAVALTLQLFCNTRSPATQLMLDRLVISLWRRGNILDDDYHTSFCSAGIGSYCLITNQYVVKHIVQTLLT